jgi:hypothetical protein
MDHQLNTVHSGPLPSYPVDNQPKTCQPYYQSEVQQKLCAGMNSGGSRTFHFVSRAVDICISNATEIKNTA